MIRIDLTQAIMRDSDNHHDYWTWPYVEWLAENVGPVVDYEYGSCLSKGEGWIFKVDTELSAAGMEVAWCVYIDDPKLANLFALRWT